MNGCEVDMGEQEPILEQCDYMHLHEKVIEQVQEELRVLKQAQLVKYRREGKTVFYSLADAHVNTILNQGLEHIEE